MVTAGSLSVSKGGIHLAKKTKKAAPQSRETAGIKSFLDMIAPSVVKFEPDHFICGNTFRCVWALREYPTQTDEQAILRHLGEKDGITLRIYTRQVTPAEEKRIIQNAANKNRMGSSNTNDLQQTITAESNLQDVASLVASMHRNREPLLHCAVYIELTASDYNTLKLLQTDVLTELVRSKLNVDRLLLRQQQGFCCASPVGYNAFGQQFERVLPASSVANLYPFNYSGKTDAKGFYVGRDKYGSNILVDFDQRDEDKQSDNSISLEVLSEEATAVVSIEDEYMEQISADEAAVLVRLLRQGLSSHLTETQRRRLWKYCVEGKPVRLIAKEECAYRNAVWKSIQAAKEKMFKLFVETGCAKPRFRRDR